MVRVKGGLIRFYPTQPSQTHANKPEYV
ncbi:hypothetical protein METHP14_20009 [Pseudomonas sp. P14-2025]